jgi:hypothetical protein
VRTNHPSKAAEPRHRKTGPARLGGDSEGGRRAREAGDEPVTGESDSGKDGTWPRTTSAR